MNSKTFRKYLDRDGGCVHCGDVETAVPHHRLNRGMGGSKERDVPSNIICLCANYNGLIESSSDAAQVAREYGWKLTSGQDPMLVPYYNANRGTWVVPSNFF
jgi:hypothetical protein